MKKITIALLLVSICGCINLSCHKFKPPHKKTCQIKTIQYNYQGNQTSLTYSYDNKRLLTSIAGNGAVINIGYDNIGRPITGNSFQNVPYRLIYENGKVVRLDYRGDDNLYHVKYTYVYDSLGRIRERIADNFADFNVSFEYEGTSPNYTRLTQLLRRPQGFPPVERWAVHTYEYDDKINPWYTWQNTTLNPFYFDLVTNTTWEYIPIPQNNVTHYTIDRSFRGSPQRSDEFFYTYQYEGDYPTRQDFLRLVTNIFIPGRVDSTRGANYYTYDCIGGNGHNGK